MCSGSIELRPTKKTILLVIIFQDVEVIPNIKLQGDIRGKKTRIIIGNNLNLNIKENLLLLKPI
jgi:hypothetical protein